MFAVFYYTDDDTKLVVELADTDVGVSIIRDYETSNRNKVIAIPLVQLDDGTWRPGGKEDGT